MDTMTVYMALALSALVTSGIFACLYRRYERFEGLNDVATAAATILVFLWLLVSPFHAVMGAVHTDQTTTEQGN